MFRSKDHFRACTLTVDIATSIFELSNFHASTTPVPPSQLPVFKPQVLCRNVQYCLRFQMPLLIAGSSLPIKPGPHDSPHETPAPGTSHWPPPFNEDNKNEYPLLLRIYQKLPPGSLPSIISPLTSSFSISNSRAFLCTH